MGLFMALTLLFVSGCRCKPDVYGDNILLEVPLCIGVSSDTINAGDTIWISAEFDKQVLELKSGQEILLDNFNFFTELGISEISDTIQEIIAVSTFSDIGFIEELPLITAISYPITYEETEDQYLFKGGMIAPNEIGLYVISPFSANILFEGYNHPALLICGNDRRSIVNVSYKNKYSTRENYENTYINTQVPFLLERATFEDYQSAGAVSFYVR
ncbi:MAG: hypothetical protein AB8H12_17405 [Lewinella sp.]